MNETRTDFLIKAASLLTRPVENKVYDILKSYYLARCPEFNSTSDPNSSVNKLRCSHCCLEWRRKTKCRVKSNKLNKKQKQRIKSSSDPNKKNILSCSQLEKICSFCGHVTSTAIPKINKKEIKIKEVEQQAKPATLLRLVVKQKDEKIKKKELAKNTQKPLNVYSNTSDVFSLKNESNKFKSSTQPVTIKNNKKKKDKFAGLCQQAVLASAKMKQEKDKNKDKLNLFLKPSK